MEHNTNKEQWIDEVLGSTKDMARAQPGEGLYEQVTARLAKPGKASISAPVIRWAAAAILLLAVNITSVVYFNSHSRRMAANGENAITLQIQSETTYNY